MKESIDEANQLINTKESDSIVIYNEYLSSLFKP